MSIISARRLLNAKCLLDWRRSTQSSSFHPRLPRTRSISSLFKATPKQVGSELYGGATSIALSSDGNRVAIGDVMIRSGNGRVRIFDWKESEWVQLGPELRGAQRFGQDLALSSDGHRVAIGISSPRSKDYGHVRIYDWEGSQWSQVGSDLVGEVSGDWFGSDIAMSSDGNRVAVAASTAYYTGYGTSHVQIFDWSDRQWNQVGPTLYVDGRSISIALSSDGNRVAIGTPFSEFMSTPSTGLVRIYDWKGNQWTQVGSDFFGEADGDGFGCGVALSSDGNRIAVGAPWHNGLAGHVRIYDWATRKEWTQVGCDLVARTPALNFGASVALSSNGDRVVIGANHLGSAKAGLVEIHDWRGSQWIPVKTHRNFFGETVVISSCGHRVAICEKSRSGPEVITSYVSVYDLEQYYFF
jgi:hypothetical protein